MKCKTTFRSVVGRIALACLITPWASTAICQVLPLHYHATRDGLIANHITALYQNSLSDLWIGTADGVSVYDGATFTNYTSLDPIYNVRIGSV